MQVEVDEDPAEVKKDEQQDVNPEEVSSTIPRVLFYLHIIFI